LYNKGSESVRDEETVILRIAQNAQIPPGARRNAAALLTAASTLIASAASGQLFQQATVFENARIILPGGKVIEHGTIVVRGDRIASVSEGPFQPSGRGRPMQIDCTGMTITPGLIDVIDLAPNTSGAGSDATHRAIDAFDHYDEARIESLLARGVTAGRVQARGGSGINGMDAVVRLRPREVGSWGEALVEEFAIGFDLGSAERPMSRLQTVDSLRKALRDAIDYRIALETYEEDLEEYEAKLKERAAKETGNASHTDGKGEKPAEGGNGSDAQGRQEERGESGGGSISEGPPQPLQGGPARRPGPGGRGGAPSGRGDAEQREGEDELKKPTAPARNPAALALLRAIDHEIPVRMTAHRSADILNAIEIADEFGLRLIIDGAAESAHVADAIAASGAQVAIDYGSQAAASGQEAERTLDLNLQALNRADVDWAVGSERNARDASRFLLMCAQIASQSAGRDPIALLTTEAAAFLGVDDSIGSIEAGRFADLVLWDGDPLDPFTQIRQVYIGGTVVHNAGAEGDQ